MLLAKNPNQLPAVCRKINACNVAPLQQKQVQLVLTRHTNPKAEFLCFLDNHRNG